MNILELASREQEGFSRHIMGLNGYKTKTTFWSDFTIADKCGGESAIKDTYKRAFNSWKDNTEYITELVLVLNHKMWHYYENKDYTLSDTYKALYEKADKWCCENLKGKDYEYYYRITD